MQLLLSTPLPKYILNLIAINDINLTDNMNKITATHCEDRILFIIFDKANKFPSFRALLSKFHIIQSIDAHQI